MPDRREAPGRQLPRPPFFQALRAASRISSGQLPLVRYLQADGRGKVLFGSNFPMIAPEKALADLDRLGLDDETRTLFLEGNARRVFDL